MTIVSPYVSAECSSDTKIQRPDSSEPGLRYLWNMTTILRLLLPQLPLQVLQQALLPALLQVLLPLQEELP